MSALHELRTEPVRDAHGRTVFRAACTCMPTGTYWYAPRLTGLYTRHQQHLDALKTASKANHLASRRNPWPTS